MKHEALIRAALDGKTIQYKAPSFLWRDFSSTRNAVSHMTAEYNQYEYRIKQEPKPDVVMWTYTLPLQLEVMQESFCRDMAQRRGGDLIKLTINGETGEKTVEIVK